MPVAPGQTLQQYRLTEKIGEGGMGEVWRALDTGLDRDVAIKILPEAVAGNRDRLARFEREAKAVAALAHPNILAVFDFGRDGDTTYMVTELLDGGSLRDRLEEGPLPARKAADLARQIARGLAAAHQRGFVHRDLKPENVFVTSEGRAKILDFGLAASTAGPASHADTHTPTATGLTSPGSVVGTANYMSPEQVRGEQVDHRSDIFSFGTVLYEMLTGVRPFHHDTAAETMTAILREDPPEIARDEGRERTMPPALERVVRRCLEKEPGERFQSASDLAFAVENAIGASTTTGSGGYPALHDETAAAAGQRRWLLPVVVAVMAVVAVAAFLAGRLGGTTHTPQPDYTQITFRQGRLSAARFAADGQTAVYSAAWDGDVTRLYAVLPGSPESRQLDIEDVELLSVSSGGELALLLQPRFVVGWTRTGTLARSPLGGGAPRVLLDDIGSADWHPDGERLAIARADGSFWSIEFPPGNELYRTAGWVDNLRFSPDGRHLAFSDHPTVGDNRGYVGLVSASGGDARRIGGVWSAVQGVAWTPDGGEIVFTAGQRGTVRELRATDLDGNMRLLSSAPVDMRVLDVNADGRVLVSRNTTARRVIASTPDTDGEVDLSWLDWSYPIDLSPDLKAVLFTEQGQGGGPQYAVYMRPTDGSPAVLLGQGQAMGFSPDGTRVVVGSLTERGTAWLYPVGVGETERIVLPGFDYSQARWIADDLLLVVGSRNGDPVRTYGYHLESGEVELLAPEDRRPSYVVYDRRTGRFIVPPENGPYKIYSIHGGDPVVLDDIEPPWQPISFVGDDSLYLAEFSRMPLPVVRYRIGSGEREPVTELMPADAAGLIDVGPAKFSADGRSYYYSFRRYLSTLYVVEGL